MFKDEVRRLQNENESNKAYYEIELEKKNKIAKSLTEKMKEIDEEKNFLKKNHDTEINQLNVTLGTLNNTTYLLYTFENTR